MSGGPGRHGFVRGFMVWDTALCAAAGYSPNDPPAVSFLFNPSTVQASYSLSASSAQSAMIFGVTTGSGGSVPFVGLQQQMSFTMLFDRTYELNTTGANIDTQFMGVEVDVRQMKQFTGMFSAQTAKSGFYTSGQNLPPNQQIIQSDGTGQGPQQGVMLLMPSYCYFSGTQSVGGTSSYYGYVDSWDVQYTHFSNSMIPIRCVIDVSYTLLPMTGNNAAEIANSAVQQIFNQNNNVTIP